MSELRIPTFCEGADDRAVLEALQKGGALPASLAFARESGGESKLASDALPFISPDKIAGRALVLRDHDDLDVAAVGAWFEKELRAKLPRDVVLTPRREAGARSTSFEVERSGRTSHIAIVPVGAPAALDLSAEHRVTWFAVDDYLLVLARELDIYSALTDVEIPHGLAHKKLGEVLDLMTANGIPVLKSKRMMHLFRAITGFRASPAVFAQRIVTKALEVRGVEAVKALCQPLVGDIEAAVAALR